MRFIASLLFAAALCGACGEDTIDGFTPAEWDVIATLSPLPETPPPDPTNQYAEDPMAAALGQSFFFESAYSGPLLVGDDGQNGGLGQEGETGKISCRSCHLGPWMIDTRSNPPATALGAGHMARNSGSLINVAYSPGHWYENDGLLDSIWGESVVDIEFDLGFNSSRLRLAHVIYDKYRDAYEAVFPPLDPALDTEAPDAERFPPDGRPDSPEWQGMTPEDQAHVTSVMVNFGKALHAYQRTLISRNAPFDQYVAGDYQAISESAKRGLGLFIGKAACVECHSGPVLSDGKFHNTGMEPMGEYAVPPGTAPDAWPLGGRYSSIPFVLDYEFNTSSVHSDDPATGRLDELVAGDEEKGQWRTKSLRQVAETAPYMRTGQMATLREVVEFYSEGGHEDGFIGVKDEVMKPLNLTEQEIDDLVAFLETLTGEEVPPALLQDTSSPGN
jgi:cytochrome c peroxidase